ncbi:MAG: hypothetical protein ACKO4Q_04070, partial [Planctomycetota bacterium]
MRLLGCIVGAFAGALAGFAVAAAVATSPLLSPSLTAAIGALLVALLGWRGAACLERMSARETQRARTRVLGAGLAALVFLLVARPFQLSPLDWVVTQSAEQGLRARPMLRIEEWGQVRTRVLELHASEQPTDATQPWRHRLEADTRYLCALGPATLRIDATLPEGAVTDPATGTRRTDANGVTCRLEALVDGEWSTLATAELDVTIAEWKSLVADLPQGTTRAALSLDARGSLFYDAVTVAMLDGSASGPLGLPLALVARLGEFLAAWIALFLAALALERFFTWCSRRARVPLLAANPQATRLPGAARALVVAVVLVAPLAIAIPVAPWLEALVTPVLITWDAPEGTPVDVRFGPDAQDRIPAVRIDGTTWRADLPPRPTYRIALELPAELGERDNLPREVRLLDHRTGGVFATSSIESFRRTSQAAADATPARLRLESDQELSPARQSHAQHVFFLWLGGTVALSVLAIAVSLLRRHSTTIGLRIRGPRPDARPILLAGLVAAAIAVPCVLATPPRMTEDSYLYLGKGHFLAKYGTVDSGWNGVEAVRTPGYPGWLAATIKLVGLDIDAITVAQALFFVGALVFLALSLRGAVRTRWLVGGVLLGALSPTQQHFMRDLMSECVFVSLCLVTLGCLLHAHG